MKLAFVLAMTVLLAQTVQAQCVFPTSKADSRGLVELPQASRDTSRITVGKQVLFRCSSDGTKQDNGDHSCVQFLGSIYTKPMASHAGYIQGALVVLDSAGNVQRINSVHVGSAAKRPAGANQFVPTNVSAAQVKAQICAARTSDYDGQTIEPVPGSRTFCACSAQNARWRQSCAGKQPLTFALNSHDYSVYPDDGPGRNGFVVEQTQGSASLNWTRSYNPLDESQKNRLIDAANGLVPVRFCGKYEPGSSYGVWDRSLNALGRRITPNQNELNGCRKRLQQPTSVAALVETRSAVYNPDGERQIGGTFTKTILVVQEARRLLGPQCSGRTANPRATYSRSQIQRLPRDSGSVR